MSTPRRIVVNQGASIGSGGQPLGTAYIDEDARISGPAPDIGADERPDADVDGIVDVSDNCPALDSGSFEPCTSPKAFSGLKKGKHTVEVRAVDAAGNVDPTPATRSWTVKKKKKR